MLGGEPVVDGENREAGPVAQGPNDALVGIQATDDPAAPMQVDEHSWLLDSLGPVQHARNALHVEGGGARHGLGDPALTSAQSDEVGIAPPVVLDRGVAGDTGRHHREQGERLWVDRHQEPYRRWRAE